LPDGDQPVETRITALVQPPAGDGVRRRPIKGLKQVLWS
jgi:hypothetical protein